MFIAGLDCLETAHTRPVDKSALAELESQARRLSRHRIAHDIAQTELPSEFLDGALLYELPRRPRLDGGGAIAHLILRAALVCHATSGAKCEGNLANLAQVEMKNPASQEWSRRISPETAAQVARRFGMLVSVTRAGAKEIDEFLEPVLAALKQRPQIARKILSAIWQGKIGVSFECDTAPSKNAWHKSFLNENKSPSNTAKGRPRGEQHHDTRKNVQNMLDSLKQVRQEKKPDSMPPSN